METPLLVPLGTMILCATLCATLIITLLITLLIITLSLSDTLSAGLDDNGLVQDRHRPDIGMVLRAHFR